MNTALTEPMRACVAQRVSSGEYGDTSEYARELIREDQREQRIQRLCALDLHIAAHARSEGLIVVTHHRREFDRVPALQVEDWPW